MAGEGWNSGGSGRHTAPADGLDTAPALAVRGFFRPRPWPAPSSSVDPPAPSVARTAPESGAHGRIADGGRPESRLEARPCWSTARASTRSDGQ